MLAEASLLLSSRLAPCGPHGKDEEGAPLALEVSGFRREALNARYSVRPEAVLCGRRTYWTAAKTASGRRFFLAWQRVLGRWAILEWHGAGPAEAEAPEVCELEACEWQAFQVDPSAAASREQWAWLDRLLMEPGPGKHWMERSTSAGSSAGAAPCASVWRRAEEAQVGAVSSPALPRLPLKATAATGPGPSAGAAAEPQLEAVDFVGFRRLELNARYQPRPEVVVNGKVTYWDSTGILFLYWQSGFRRWAICSRRHLDMVRKGQCLGCACQLDQVHFSAPSRWVELVDGTWASAFVEVNALPGSPDAACAPPASAATRSRSRSRPSPPVAAAAPDGDAALLAELADAAAAAAASAPKDATSAAFARAAMKNRGYGVDLQ